MNDSITWKTIGSKDISAGKRKNYGREQKNRKYEVLTNDRKLKQEKNKPTIGLRAKFFQSVENSDLSIEKDMENFIQENRVYSKNDLIIWLKEELKKEKVSEKVLYKIKLYLEKLEQEKIKESDNDGR